MIGKWSLMPWPREMGWTPGPQQKGCKKASNFNYHIRPTSEYRWCSGQNTTWPLLFKTARESIASGRSIHWDQHPPQGPIKKGQVWNSNAAHLEFFKPWIPISWTSLCQRGGEAGTGKGFAQNSSVGTSWTTSSDRSTILPVSNNKY